MVGDYSDPSVRIDNASSGQLLNEYAYDAYKMVWGDYLVVGTGYDGLIVIDPQNGQILRTFPNFVGIESQMTVSPSGDLIAFSEIAGPSVEQIRVVNLNTGVLSSPFGETSGLLNSLDWVNEGIIGQDIRGITRLWDVETGQAQILNFGVDVGIDVDNNLNYILVDDPAVGLYVQEGNTGAIYSTYPGNPVILPTSTPRVASTATPNPTALPALQRLRLTSMCSATPALTRRWRVRSTNSYPVTFTWNVVGTPNTLRVFVGGGAPQDVKASSGAAC